MNIATSCWHKFNEDLCMTQSSPSVDVYAREPQVSQYRQHDDPAGK